MADGTASNGLRCRPGDLAVVVRAPADAYIPAGAIVRCIRFLPGPFLLGGKVSSRWVSGVWEVGYQGRTGFGKPDAELRPIRDPGDDVTDETLIWLPAPAAQQATRTPAPVLNPATAPA